MRGARIRGGADGTGPALPYRTGVARFRSLSASAVLGLIMALAMGCVAPDQGATGTATLLYVANSRDGTITRLDVESGRSVGVSLPAGPAPWQIAPGPEGSLIVLSGLPDHSGELTHIAPGRLGWTTRTVRLGEPANDAVVAGDGGRYAALAHHVPLERPRAPAPAGHCRLALVDVLTARIERTTPLCLEGEWLSGLALANGEAGPIAYVGIRGAAGRSGVESSMGRNRIVAINAATGALLAAAPLAGEPKELALGPAPGRVGSRLYAVESLAGPEHDPSYPSFGRLLGLSTDTLAVESSRVLGFVPARLAVTPDGDQAYALHDQDVVRLDLLGQADARLAFLPEPGHGLAVTHDRVYVSRFFGSALWVLDRHRDGQANPLSTVPVGGRPTAIVLGRSA
jgi:DNA-binding beta-propeller fold protein YncE